MAEQQSTMVEWIDASLLKAHPKNIEIYGEDGYQDLISSIKELGVLQAIYVRQDNTVISGHRRWRAAKEVNQQVPIIRVRFSSPDDEVQAIIEHNRYRIKNGLQLYNEGKELEVIEEKKAKKRMGTSHPEQGCENFHKAEDSRSHDIVAKAIGLGSGRQWDKLSFIADNKPELLQTIRQSKSLDSAYHEVQREQRRNDIKDIPIKELEGMYNVFLVDPPWQYDNQGTAIRGTAENHYSTMLFEDILKMPIQEHTLDNAVLFLWTTNSMIKKAFTLIEEWGFEFKTSMVWVKNRIGTGFFVRSKHELVFIATKGHMLPMTMKIPESVFFADKKEHSKKPDSLYSIIEAMYPEQRYAELFARDKRTGWYSWGNEV